MRKGTTHQIGVKNKKKSFENRAHSKFLITLSKKPRKLGKKTFPLGISISNKSQEAVEVLCLPKYQQKKLKVFQSTRKMISLQKTCFRLLAVSTILENSSKLSPQGYRHDDTVKQFAASLLCLTGSGGYGMLQANLGNALPHITTAQKVISQQRKIVEGEFYFDELLSHLKKWKAPLFVNLHLDDTRIINKVEYDPTSDRFVGFVLPLDNGLPVANTFQLNTFEEIETSFSSAVVGKYAHCMVIKPVDTSAPAFVLFTMCTDSKYDYQIISKRLMYVRRELRNIGITILSHGADGAGPFLKAMNLQSGLFDLNHGETVPKAWTFYWMPELFEESLSCQDTINLLAKLRTRLLTPSNLIVLGSETACRGHLQHVLKSFSKSDHGLSPQVLENKDKQNYDSIEKLLGNGVQVCLEKIKPELKTKGTIMYLWLMRNIRDAFFNKSISPLERIALMWKTLFFCESGDYG